MKLIATKSVDAVLCFTDGTSFFGKGVGVMGEARGEVCFNTSITGYQEILTDPSYAGQIITFTFPHIGNVGCNPSDQEAKKVFCNGLIIRNDITQDSNFRSEMDLNSWLIDNNLTGISGIDTRALTRYIRTNGASNVIIDFKEEGTEINTLELTAKIKDLPSLAGTELSSIVSTIEPYRWQDKTIDLTKIKNQTFDHGYKIVVLDFGVKQTILSCLASHGFDIVVLPAKASFDDIAKYNPDGIFLSNGPGDPFATSEYALPVIRQILDKDIPIFGICMGHQLLCIASGLITTKMVQGHRGGNHPVKNLQTGLVEITSQNHGFCVSKETIPSNVEITHVSLFDSTIEGIRLRDKPAFSVQYHPESSPGPHDSRYLFKEFIQLIDESK
ncbi:MAG: carbamoyl-phosphate synthase small subunit [Patiriisocius sp.]|jgi:carbamoyl-phosphate synthase small subunit